MTEQIDTANRFLVGVKGDGVVILNPPRVPLNRPQCLLLAAYLVALVPIAGDEDMNVDDEFARVLSAVRNS